MCMQIQYYYFIQYNEICLCNGASILEITIAKCELLKKKSVSSGGVRPFVALT